MVRISGVDLNDKWKLDYALTRLKGIGWALSDKVLKETKIADDKRVADLTKDEVSNISSYLENLLIEGDLIRFVKGNIKRIQTVGTYRGIRHSRGLPARGQRTKSNGRTKRGKRKTVGSFRKEALAKMQTKK